MSTSPSPRPNVSFGLIPESHLDGGVAVVVRDPHAAEPNLIVLSREAVSKATDDALYLATRRLLALDTATEPVLTQGWDDGQVGPAAVSCGERYERGDARNAAA